MSPTSSDPGVKPKSNIYTALSILAAIFLIGGIAFLYLLIMPYRAP